MKENTYPEKHGLCGVYYRIQRGGKWESVCISDMTGEEIATTTENMDKETLRRLVATLADSLHFVGELGNIYSSTEDKYD